MNKHHEHSHRPFIFFFFHFFIQITCTCAGLQISRMSCTRLHNTTWTCSCTAPWWRTWGCCSHGRSIAGCSRLNPARCGCRCGLGCLKSLDGRPGCSSLGSPPCRRGRRLWGRENGCRGAGGGLGGWHAPRWHRRICRGGSHLGNKKKTIKTKKQKKNDSSIKKMIRRKDKNKKNI